MSIETPLTVSSMQKSLEKAEVAYHQFALHTRQGKDGLFCFFEGERGTDNPYYVPRIKQFTENYHPISCGGRDKVLKVHELIRAHEEYNIYKKAFFIDRDFNVILTTHIPPIFETECYSIENFYVSLKVFKEILKNSFQLSEVDESFEICVSIFTQRQREYHAATTLFNAWYSCLIEIRNETGKPTGVGLDDKLPTGFISFSLDSISSNYNIDTIKKLFPDSTEVSNERLQEKIKEFSVSDHQKVFRGKYELTFVRKLVELIVADSSNTNKYLKRKISFPFGGLSNDQAISVFSAYAETPESLIVYLKNVMAE